MLCVMLMQNKIIQLSVFFCLLFMSFCDARAEEPCAVPVCNIPAQIESLRTMTQAQRYKFVNELRSTLKTKQDKASFENLRDFALQARALFV